MRKLYLLLYVLWMGGCLWPVSHRFVDAETSPKWYAAMFGATLFFCVRGFGVLWPQWKRPRPLSYTVFSLSVLCCAVPLSLYALWQWGGFGGAASVRGVCGPFDNPAGLSSALAFSLPACLFVSSSRRRWLRCVALSGLVCLMAGILVTGSRAGMLSAAAVLFLHLLHVVGMRRRKLMAVGAVLLLMFSVGLYHYKKDSADGRLYGHLGDDPFFLYNYAAELNVAGRYAESLRVATECEGMMADYFTQLLLADDCRRLGRYGEAERHLWQASFMCPNRFVPPYELFKLYEARHDSAGMRRMRNVILKKSVKVDSPEVRKIIREMSGKNGF